MPGYAKRTVEAALRFIDDPMFLVRSDGTIWKRAGLPDAAGSQAVSMQVGPREYVSIPVRLAVFLQHVTKDVPDGEDWRIIHADGNPHNNAADNLKLVEQPPAMKRSNIDAALAVQIRTDYKSGKSQLEIAQERGLTVKAVKNTLFGNGKNGR
jgi:hypothetical protein